MNVLVRLLHMLKQGILTFFCAMDPSKSLVKPTDPFSQKCTEIHKINCTDYISSTTINIIYCTTKEPNYAQIQFSKY